MQTMEDVVLMQATALDLLATHIITNKMIANKVRNNVEFPVTHSLDLRVTYYITAALDPFAYPEDVDP